MIESSEPYGTYATRDEVGRPWGCTRDKAELWVNILLSRCYDRFPLERCVIYPNPIERLGLAEMVKEIRN